MGAVSDYAWHTVHLFARIVFFLFSRSKQRSLNLVITYIYSIQKCLILYCSTHMLHVLSEGRHKRLSYVFSRLGVTAHGCPEQVTA